MGAPGPLPRTFGLLPCEREVFSLCQRVGAVLVSCATEWENQLHGLQLSPL